MRPLAIAFLGAVLCTLAALALLGHIVVFGPSYWSVGLLAANVLCAVGQWREARRLAFVEAQRIVAEHERQKRPPAD